MVQVGQMAPDFELEGASGGEFCQIKLSDFRGKWVVLFFWPLDFTFVCPTEIKAFSKRIKEFEELDAQILGASIDSKFTHLAWKKDLGNIAYPMLSDINKQVCKDYGILIDSAGIALRGLFIIDPDGVLQYQVVQNLNIGRNIDEILRVLKALQTGELCPVDWDEGQETLGKG